MTMTFGYKSFIFSVLLILIGLLVVTNCEPNINDFRFNDDGIEEPPTKTITIANTTSGGSVFHVGIHNNTGSGSVWYGKMNHADSYGPTAPVPEEWYPEDYGRYKYYKLLKWRVINATVYFFNMQWTNYSSDYDPALFEENKFYIRVVYSWGYNMSGWMNTTERMSMPVDVERTESGGRVDIYANSSIDDGMYTRWRLLTYLELEWTFEYWVAGTEPPLPDPWWVTAERELDAKIINGVLLGLLSAVVMLALGSLFTDVNSLSSAIRPEDEDESQSSKECFISVIVLMIVPVLLSYFNGRIDDSIFAIMTGGVVGVFGALFLKQYIKDRMDPDAIVFPITIIAVYSAYVHYMYWRWWWDYWPPFSIGLAACIWFLLLFLSSMIEKRTKTEEKTECKTIEV